MRKQRIFWKASLFFVRHATFEVKNELSLWNGLEMEATPAKKMGAEMIQECGFSIRQAFFRRKKPYQPYRLGCNQKQQSTTYTPSLRRIRSFEEGAERLRRLYTFFTRSLLKEFLWKKRSSIDAVALRVRRAPLAKKLLWGKGCFQVFRIELLSLSPNLPKRKIPQ
jgi:hypothetical protein